MFQNPYSNQNYIQELQNMRERIDRQLGREILPYAEKLGLGSREYELINID